MAILRNKTKQVILGGGLAEVHFPWGMANSLLRRGRFPRGPWTTHLSLPGCWTKASISSSPAVCGAKPSRTLYEVLGVEPSADQATIKEAFYAKSKELHPDSAVAQGVENAGEAFRELAAAYEVLRDPNTRKEYDDSKKSTFQSSRVQGRAHQGVRRESSGNPLLTSFSANSFSLILVR